MTQTLTTRKDPCTAERRTDVKIVTALHVSEEACLIITFAACVQLGSVLLLVSHGSLMLDTLQAHKMQHVCDIFVWYCCLCVAPVKASVCLETFLSCHIDCTCWHKL